MKILNPNWTVRGFNKHGEEVARFEESRVEHPPEDLITEFVNSYLGITRVEVDKSYHVYSDETHEGMPEPLAE